MIEKIARNLRLLYLVQIYAWKTQLAYRVQALVWLINFVAQALLTFVFISVMYSVSAGIPGWSYFEMLLLSSSTIMMMGLVNYFVDIYNIGQNLLAGDFDAQLARPVSAMTIMFSNFNGVTLVASFLTGLAIFAYAASHLGLTLGQLALFALFFGMGTFIVMLFLIVLVMSSYKLFRGGAWVNWVTNTLSGASKYPLSIYGTVGTLIFTFLVPMGFATYYPIEAVTGKLSTYAIVAVFVGMLIFIFALLRIFSHLFKSYSSGMG
ncbi:MAG: ABC-2 family transporter protein [Candidatus Micrarchaeota archaeon]|nr:ABC-2 family transporter protein [Candidatus Micrarchaeota archaeon]